MLSSVPLSGQGNPPGPDMGPGPDQPGRELNDADRGDGLAQYIKLCTKSQNSPAGELKTIKEELCSTLGLSMGRIEELLRISRFSEDAKEPIRQQKIAGKTALVAERIGGPEAVKTVAEKGMGYRAAEAIQTEFAALPETTEQEKKVKQKVRERFARGDIDSADDVVKTARQAKAQVVRKAQNVPPDLIDVMRSWTERARRWADELEQVAPYTEYIDSEPKVAERWRAAVKVLIEKLEKFS